MYNNTPIEFLIDKSIFTAYIAAKRGYYRLQAKREREYDYRIEAFGVDRDSVEDYTPEQEEAARLIEKALDAELGELKPAYCDYVEASERAFKEAARFVKAEAVSKEHRDCAEIMANLTHSHHQQKFIELTCKNLGLRVNSIRRNYFEDNNDLPFHQRESSL